MRFGIFLLLVVVWGCKPEGWVARPLFKTPDAIPAPPTSDPTIKLTQPTSGQIVSGIFTAAVAASATIGVKQVEFYVDGIRRSNIEMTPPYEFIWNTAEVPDGQHVFTAKMLDAGSATTTSAPVNVTIKNSVFTDPPVAVNQAVLSWTAPTTNVDGSPLNDLAGYKVLQSNSLDTVCTNPSLEFNVSKVLTYTVEGLPRGEHFFAVKAVDLAGNKSLCAGPVSKVIP